MRRLFIAHRRPHGGTGTEPSRRHWQRRPLRAQATQDRKAAASRKQPQPHRAFHLSGGPVIRFIVFPLGQSPTAPRKHWPPGEGQRPPRSGQQSSRSQQRDPVPQGFVSWFPCRFAGTGPPACAGALAPPARGSRWLTGAGRSRRTAPSSCLGTSPGPTITRGPAETRLRIQRSLATKQHPHQHAHSLHPVAQPWIKAALACLDARQARRPLKGAELLSHSLGR